MNAALHLKQPDQHLYLPEPARILAIKDFSEQDRFFSCELLSGQPLGHVPGQFIELSIMGIGEAPISVSSEPRSDATFDLCVRAVGDVTTALHQLKVGDIFYIRGPFGHGFDEALLQKWHGKHLMFIAGGIGYVPLRSLINKILNNGEQKYYHKITVLHGCRSCRSRTYPDELEKIAKMGGNVELLETVDCVLDGETWEGCVGVITTLVPQVDFDPDNTIPIVVGPPIMFKFVLQTLKERDIPAENIYVSLERRMKCGIGKCGHCKMEGVYVCQEGPIFNYTELLSNKEAF